MRFKDKLGNLMGELGITQTKLHELTDIGKSSISQYLAGKNEPTNARKKEIARALGVEEDYFTQFLPVTEPAEGSPLNLPVSLAAQLMGKSQAWVKKGLQDGVFPWGYGVKMKKWSYWISSVKFTEFTGIQVPVKE